MNDNGRPGPLFGMGRVVATPGALANFPREELDAALRRHISGDWGDLDEDNKGANDHAASDEERILSSYNLKNGTLWIITEADRSSTTFLLPEEY